MKTETTVQSFSTRRSVGREEGAGVVQFPVCEISRKGESTATEAGWGLPGAESRDGNGAFFGVRKMLWT